MLRDDPTVALRFEVKDLPEPPPTRLTLRLRGTAFDAYDGHAWARTQHDAIRQSERAYDSSDTYPLFRAPDPAHDRVVSFDLEPIDPPVVFLPPRAVALRLRLPTQILLGEAVTLQRGAEGRAALQRLGRPRPALRRLPRRRARGLRRAPVARGPGSLSGPAADALEAHRRPGAPLDRRPRDAAGEGARHRGPPAPRVHLRPALAVVGHAGAGGPFPLRVAAGSLRVLLHRHGPDAPDRGRPVAQRDGVRGRHVEPLRSLLRRARGRRALLGRGVHRRSRRTRRGERSTRPLPAARSRSSLRAAPTTTCATSWRRSRSAGTRTSSATTFASRSTSSRS